MGHQEHIIFVVLDTVRADHTSLCGYERPTTPTLERLARDHASWTCDAYAPGSWTLPSHASYFTGLDVLDHGVHFAAPGAADGVPVLDDDNIVHPLPSHLETLAETLAAAGYRTLSMSANPLVAPFSGLTQGFDVVHHGETFTQFRGPRMMALVRQVLDDEVAVIPTFVFINIADAHQPYPDIPADVVDWVRPQKAVAPLFIGGPQSLWVRYVRGEMAPEETTRVRRQVRDGYDFGLYRADQTLGQLIDYLEDHPIGRAGYRLIVVSDHGELLGEHQLLDHGHYLWEPNNRVPLLVWDKAGTPSLQGPLDASAAYHLALETAGLGPFKAPPARAIAFPGQLWVRWSGGVAGGSTAIALWRDRTKLLWMDGVFQRFDLDRDPEELHPLSAEQDPGYPQLKAELERLNQSPDRQGVSQELLEKLRAIGYVQ